MATIDVHHTAFLVTNLHCPSCVSSIEVALGKLNPPPLAISHSIVQHTVTVAHPTSLSIETITDALEEEGYEVCSVIADPLSAQPKVLREDSSSQDERRLEKRPSGLRRLISHASLASERRKQQRHRDNCEQCRLEGTTEDQREEQADVRDIKHDFVVIDLPKLAEKFTASLTVEGMTCASCTGTVTQALQSRPWIETANVNLLGRSATVTFSGRQHAEELVSIIEDAGYNASLEQVADVGNPSPGASDSGPDIWRASYSVGGMTCSSCVVAITRALKELSWVQNVEVNLVAHGATVVFEGKEHLDDIGSLLDDIGYEASLTEVVGINRPHQAQDATRTIQIYIQGMYCDHCPIKVVNTIEGFGREVTIKERPTTKNSIMTICYTPSSPKRTIRSILSAISAADAAFQPSIYHPMTIEERSQRMHLREQRRILYRLLFSVIVAIPTFVIGIVYMSLVSSSNPSKRYLMSPLGGASRAEWAVFIMATPVYFFAADIFHRRMLKELSALWRKRSPTPMMKRLYRFGSMNMLISLGTTIAYISSIAKLAIDAAQNKGNKMQEHTSPTYFDSVVFLTMFLLIGRYIEAHSKAKTGDAVAMLGKLRPTEALLETSGDTSDSEKPETNFQKVNVDLLERGDTVRVPNGASPPCDGIVSSGSSQFDESSLTGESRPVRKQMGDTVFSGTVNQGSAISIRIIGAAGNSMLDRIMMVVREGQTRRAPVERVADRITGYFVPFICLVAIVTWVTWLSLGLSGALPLSYRDTANNWAFWSLQFAIAVFIVACPCGIGLAAPTALFVGGGLAAKFGILVKGGGEAFQEASTLDCIVFDKTGTLTEGGEPVVTDYLRVGQTLEESMILATLKAVEEDSSHPIAKAVVDYCKESGGEFQAKETSEVAGRGMKGSGTSGDTNIDVLVGNETFMNDYSVPIPPSTLQTLNQWKRQAKSVVLAAIKTSMMAQWELAAIFSISDPIRPEAAHVVSALQDRKIDIWMISGDNEITARATGDKLSIPHSNIIAGVLPEQKAEKIKFLQKGSSSKGNKRATVAMVGDGINDSPALSTSDVAIAIGSGSDVAISTASFVLLTSDLTALLTLIDLSRLVFRRIKFNFFWALIYNLAALPIAAGVLFPVKTGGGGHVRLDPAWAALAMALSSVSVVCSSLLLRSKIPGVGFKALKRSE